LTITMCLPCAIALQRVADAGLRIAGRLDDHLDVRERRSARRILRDVGAAALERVAERGRLIGLLVPAAEASAFAARSAERSAMPTRCMPRVRRTCARNMVPNLPAPIRPTVTGRPAASRSSSRHEGSRGVSFLSLILITARTAPPGKGAAACYFAQMMRRASIAAALETEQGIVTGIGLDRSFVQELEAAVTTDTSRG
jgi:hypothetical protein